MSEYDVVIIGGGPAGLTAGLYLVREKRRTILLEKENFGGWVQDVEWIENYPGFANGVSGAQLASEMVTQAQKYGLQPEQAEVIGIEIYSSSKWVQCSGGKGYTTDAIIIAGGAKHKKLGIPGEEELYGKGIINCTLCDSGLFKERVVAVCGGGDAGVTQALYLAKLTSKVILIEAESSLTASAILKERALSNPKIDIRCKAKVESIIGKSQVEALELVDVENGHRSNLKVDGILVHIGFEPNTSYLEGIVPVDTQGQIIVNGKMETEVSGIFAAGDIRHNSLRQVATAVGDGATAALSAERFLRERQSLHT